MNKQRKNDLKKIKESRERKIQKGAEKHLENKRFHLGRKNFIEHLEKVGWHLDGNVIVDKNGGIIQPLIACIILGAIN